MLPIVNPVPDGRVPQPPAFTPFDRRDLDSSIPSRFDRVVSLAPERLAVKTSTEALTYRAVAQTADRVARAVLDAAGPSPQPVALLLSQGAAVVTAILGVLKAGHFYVPFDVSFPDAALLGMLRDCGANLIVTDSSHMDLARRLSAAAAPLDLDNLAGSPAAGIPVRHIAADDTAYIYYTSGSTGAPKGVVDTHRNVLHNIMRYTNGLYLSASDRLTLLQAPAFSGAVSSLFGALLNGATVFPYDVARDGLREIGTWLNDERVTVYHSVPTIFRHFLQTVDKRQTFPAVRVVRLEGDRASPGDVGLFRQHFTDDAVLAHGLGATECGLVRRFVVDRRTGWDGPLVPIGYPVEDMNVRVLDDEGREVAHGGIGEIAVESRYLSLGYWKRPDLTEKAFEAGLEPGARLYRTGDIGRMRIDGCLEHLGRKDSQPKLRGQRVDCEAIEAALLGMGLIVEAVVDVRDGPNGEGRLVAYIVPQGQNQLSASVLRRRLARVLPPALVPARFVAMTALPLTSNRKIDRRALPDPDRDRPQLETPFIAPTSRLEMAIAAIFGETLGLDQVGVRDDFFELGGDSLGATVLLERIRQQHGTDLPTHLIFESPSVERLARAIEATGVPARRDVATTEALVHRRSPLVAVQPRGTRRPFFFLHAEYGGDGFYCLNVARHLGPDQPFYALSPHGRDEGPMPIAIETMASGYVSALREVQTSGPYLLGGFCSSSVVAWEMGCQLRASGEAVDLLVLVEPQTITRRPWWRVIHAVTGGLAAFRPGGPERRLALTLALTDRIEKGGRPTLRDLRRSAVRILGMPEAIAPIHPSEARGTQIAAVYSRAVRGYLPRRFDGPVLCLRAADEADQGSADEWRRLAREFTDCLIPGDHDSCIITHARSLADVLGPALAEAQAQR